MEGEGNGEGPEGGQAHGLVKARQGKQRRRGSTQACVKPLLSKLAIGEFDSPLTYRGYHRMYVSSPGKRTRARVSERMNASEQVSGRTDVTQEVHVGGSPSWTAGTPTARQLSVLRPLCLQLKVTANAADLIKRANDKK